jgi:hypothetical protein
MRLFKSQEEKQQIAAARSDLQDFVKAAASAEPEQARKLAVAFKSNPRLAVLSEKERKFGSHDAFRTYAENVLSDDHLTIDEEMAFQDVGEALGIGPDDLQGRYRDLLARLVVAKANDGRLDVVESPQLMTKKNEVVHLETAAALMKEVVLREWRAGSSGYSFRIAKGVRYRVGNTRGRSVVVGTELQVEDNGTLAVTSLRAAYMGSRKTMEFPYAKILGLDVFDDGIQFHSSNRQRTPLFRVESGSGDVIAAILNTAMQRLNE